MSAMLLLRRGAKRESESVCEQEQEGDHHQLLQTTHGSWKGLFLLPMEPRRVSERLRAAVRVRGMAAPTPLALMCVKYLHRRGCGCECEQQSLEEEGTARMLRTAE